MYECPGWAMLYTKLLNSKNRFDGAIQFCSWHYSNLNKMNVNFKLCNVFSVTYTFSGVGNHTIPYLWFDCETHLQLFHNGQWAVP